MIEIVKEGNPNKRNKRITCPYCGAELKYEPKDEQITIKQSGAKYIICPWCNDEVITTPANPRGVNGGYQPLIDEIG